MCFLKLPRVRLILFNTCLVDLGHIFVFNLLSILIFFKLGELIGN